MDKKKILVINTKYREFGGEDSNIIEELNLLKQNFTTEYLEFDNNEKLSITDLISFFTLNNKKSNRKLLIKLKEFNPDIVYVNNTWFKANLGIIKLLKEKKLPIFLKIHNFRYDCSRYFLSRNHLNGSKICFKCGFEYKTFKFFNKYYSNSYLRSLALIIYGKKYFKILKKDISNIFVLNNFHKDYIEKLGIEPDKITVSYNPINKIKEKEIYFNKTANYVVYAGRVVNEKGLYELIQAWKQSKTTLNLKIIGEGPLRSELENLISDLEICDRVSLPGLSKDIHEDYNIADIFVIPSKFESFGIVTAEAMLYSLPVIGFSDCIGTNKLIIDNITGLLVQPSQNKVLSLASAMEKLMKSETKRLKFGKAGLNRINLYSSNDIIADKWERFLKKNIN